jgi:membrane associated rhomboid family serine protease
MTASKTTSFGKRAVTAPLVRAPTAPAVVADSTPAAPSSPLTRTLSRLPYFTVVLSLALIYRFKAELTAATDWDAPNAPGYFSLLALGASGRQQIVEQGEWWRLFTAASLHGSLDHLIGNLITFAIVGLLLEPMIGIGWFAAIYFTGGFAGTVLSMLINPADMLSVGASGAIMATLAALFTLSFHAGAPRPNLMRRVAAGALFPALIPAVSSGGATVDIHAHLGGCLAGAALAFAMLIFWREEDEYPPGRSLAAALAGLWVALTVWAFSASTQTYAQYAKDGFDYIPPNEMPRDMLSGSYALVEKYGKDPRAHMFRGLYFLGKRNAADAEPYFRTAIRLGEKSPVMGDNFRDWSVALLGLSVAVQRRPAEAQGIVAPVCAKRDTLDRRTRETLQITRLC